MSKYNQPFYIPFGMGKMNYHTGIRGGYYLPALERDTPNIEERLARLEEMEPREIITHEPKVEPDGY